MEFLYEVVCRAHRTASGEQIVVEQDNVVFVDGILVDFDSVRTVFLGVALLHGFSGQLTRLAAEYHAGAEPYGEGGRQHEAAALDTHDFRDAFVLVDFIQFIDHYLQALRIFEQSGHVSEVNSLLRKIRYAPQIFQ